MRSNQPSGGKSTSEADDKRDEEFVAVNNEEPELVEG